MNRRRRKLTSDLAAFMRQYRRKSDAPHDPNDRQYDRELEAKIKRMPPEELDRLLNGDIDDEAVDQPDFRSDQPTPCAGRRTSASAGSGDRVIDWRHLKVEGLGPITRQVALFQVGPPLSHLPFASFKVKVLERPDGSFLGVPNVARRSADGSPDWIAGLGPSIEESLEDTLRSFARTTDLSGGTTEGDFVWAAPEDF